MDVNEDWVKDRWSRYIGAMGIEAVQKQATSSVFLSGASAFGIETAKNIVLAGCKRFVLHDTRKASLKDLSGQFFLQPEDVGKNRAEACLNRLRALNYTSITVESETFEIPTKESELEKLGFDKYTVIILSEVSYKQAVAVNEFCWKKGVKFIYADVWGPFARAFCDFGDFTVVDKDGEQLKDCLIKEINPDGTIECLENTRHGFNDGD